MTSRRTLPPATRLKHVLCGLAAGLAGCALAGAARAETVTLESPVLRLQLNTDPYSYSVIEKAGGQVLVAQSATSFIVAESAPTPMDAGASADGPLDVVGPDRTDGPTDGALADRADGAVDSPGDVPGPVAPDAPLVDPSATRPWKALRATIASRTAVAIEAQLTLEGTTDTARVKFSFSSPETLEVQLGIDRPNTRRIKEEFEDRDERIYGIWEYPFDGNLGNRGVDRDYLGFGRQTGSLYTSARAPFYMSSRRYGVYAHTSARGRFTVAVAGKTSFVFDVPGPQPGLAYTIIHGSGYYDLLKRYTAITGGPFMPPLWAFGSIWWADDFHRDLRNAANAQENVLDLATQLQSQRIPAAGLLLDRPFGTGTNGWGNMDWAPSFPDPPAMVAGLRARGLELVLWIANRAWNNLYTEGQAQGLLFPGSLSLGPAADVRNRVAYDWWKAKLAPFVELGVKGYKIDRGEQGEYPDAVQSENVTLYARLAQESLAAKHGSEAFVFARNVADTGRKHTAVWNGDSEANFTGLAYSIAAGLRSGLIGMPMWGSDAGGYLRSSNTPTEEVFARWLGFGAYSPMMEVLVGDGHTPWYDYSPALVDIARKHASAHHDLIPYTRSFMHAAVLTGAPVMRPLLLEYPDDPALANTLDQYLFGSELLVAPVITPGATMRSVYVPPGRWLDYNQRRQAVHSGAAGGTMAGPRPAGHHPGVRARGGHRPPGRHPESEQQLDAELGAQLAHRGVPRRRQPVPQLRLFHRHPDRDDHRRDRGEHADRDPARAGAARTAGGAGGSRRAGPAQWRRAGRGTRLHAGPGRARAAHPVPGPGHPGDRGGGQPVRQRRGPAAPAGHGPRARRGRGQTGGSIDGSGRRARGWRLLVSGDGRRRTRNRGGVGAGPGAGVRSATAAPGGEPPFELTEIS